MMNMLLKQIGAVLFGVLFLEGCGGNPNQENKGGQASLKQEALDIFNRWTKNGKDLSNINDCERDGGSPTDQSLLGKAISIDNPDLLELCIKRGKIDLGIDQRDGFWTAIQRLALKYDGSWCFQRMLDKGVNIKLPTFNERGLQDDQHWFWHLSGGRILQIWIKNGLDVKIQDDQGRNILHRALLSAVPLKGVQSLLSHGADPNAQDQNGQTPLHMAVAGMPLQYVQILLDQGANPNVQDQNGQTPLHFAACCGSINPNQEFSLRCEVVKLLLQEGGDKSKADNSGMAPVSLVPSNPEYNPLRDLLTP